MVGIGIFIAILFILGAIINFKSNKDVSAYSEEYYRYLRDNKEPKVKNDQDIDMYR
jgi:hypothetical protein